MMRLFDGFRLANAKLKSHRIRTGIVVVIVSLLFAGIITILCIVAGTTQSLEKFNKEGLGSRFILQAMPIYDFGMWYSSDNQSMIDQLQPLSDQLKKDKIAEAKRLNIPYDPTNDQTLPIFTIVDNGTKKSLANPQSQVFKDLVKTNMINTPNIRYDDFKKLAKSSGAINFYRGSYGGISTSTEINNNGSIVAISEGKEEQPDGQSSPNYGPPKGVNTLVNYGFSQFDRELLSPFVLKGQNLSVGENGSIPVIIPVSAAEEILGRKPLPSSASNEDQLAYVEQLRKDIAGKETELCYRNNTSKELYNLAKQQRDEMERNKSNKEYVPPSLQYNLPETACGEVTVKKDTRSADEKKFQTSELDFKRKFESYENADQGIIRTRIVGLVTEPSYSMSFSAKDILSSIMLSTLGVGWFTPQDTVQTGSYASRISTPFAETIPMQQGYYAEFSDYKSAKAFMEKQNCVVNPEIYNEMSYASGQLDKRVAECHKQGKYFDIFPYGNNASAIEDIKQGVWKVVAYAAPVVLIIASLVLMGIVGKLIADSRRETAVFRALGATRFDIAQIYFTYSLNIAMMIAAMSVVIGAITAYFISQKLSPELSVTAALVYNTSDLSRQFTLFGLDPVYIGFVCLLILVAVAIATLIPLITNIRRNPIRDMRDE